MLVPLEPLMDVALDPVVDVPLEPITGALGATGALLGTVPPIDLLDSSGVTGGVSVESSGRNAGRRTAALPGDRPLPARHFFMNLALCLPT
jgi:hypothetical protein